MKKTTAWIGAFALLLGSSLSHAQHDMAEYKLLQASMKDIAVNPEALQERIRAGRERAVLCGYCHGQQGISTRGWIPNLAGQNRDYLLYQTVAYATGQRKDLTMNQLMRDMDRNELIDLSLYFASLPVEKFDPRSADPARVKRGAQLYAKRCRHCHGENGKSDEGFARLAGQKPDYLRLALKRYQERAEGRTNPTMAQMADGLSEMEIEALAAYLTTLP